MYVCISSLSSSLSRFVLLQRHSHRIYLHNDDIELLVQNPRGLTKENVLIQNSGMFSYHMFKNLMCIYNVTDGFEIISTFVCIYSICNFIQVSRTFYVMQTCRLRQNSRLYLILSKNTLIYISQYSTRSAPLTPALWMCSYSVLSETTTAFFTGSTFGKH